jgi:pyruvate/2-oxoglutarate dehydrogenase complex dihydrolipoamide acyltransferase (E2) component
VLIAGSLLLATNVALGDAPGPNAPPIQVIAIRSDDAEDQADALTGALRNRVRALRGFSLGDGDYALEVLTLGLKCGETPDESCQIKIGNQIHADRFVWGNVKRSKSAKQVVAELHLWTRGRPSTKTEFAFSDNLTAPGDDSLRRLVDEALNILLERQKAPTAAGSASAPARAPAARPTTPAPSSTPAAATPDPPAATPAVPSNSSDAAGSNLHSALGWTGIGVGGALIAAGVFSVFRVNAIESDPKVERYRQGFRPEVDSCEQAEAGVSSIAGSATPAEMQDFCSTAGTFKTLEFVFFGLGAISAGAGIYLLATDSGASAARSRSYFAVTPPLGRSGGRVEFGFRF